jgi:hypothetical protein
MAKYGLFRGGEKEPMQTFEGTSMVQNADHVYIYREDPQRQGHGPQVAAVKLGDGQCVKEIEK